MQVREILSSLKDPDPRRRRNAWNAVERMKDDNLFPLIKSRLYLRSLLWNSLEGIREDAWSHLDLLVYLNVKGIERTLKARSDTIKWSAWQRVNLLVEKGIVDWGYIYSVRDSYWRLLKSRYPTIRKKAWKLFQKLVKEGIFTEKDKPRYMNLLKAEKASIRVMAWKNALSTRLFSKEELRNILPYLQELTKEDSKVKLEAEKIIHELS